MEQNQTTLPQHALVYGLILGLALIVYSVLLYMLDLTFNFGLSLLSWVVLIIGIYIGSKAYRDKVLGGTISYGAALGTGILIALVAGVISTLFSYILTNIIDPGLVEKSFQVIEERMAKKGLPDEQIEMIVSRMRERSSPVKTLVIGFVAFTVFGIIISLITSAFVKKEGNPFTGQENSGNQ